jgi:hypothetical protein
LSSVTKAFAENYPLLNSSIVMILAGALWGPFLALTVILPFLLPLTLHQFPSPVFGGLVAAIGSIPLWFAARDWLQIKFRDWMIAIGLGLAGGLGAGSLIFQSQYPPMPVDISKWVGWQLYMALIFGCAGTLTGVAIWFAGLRSIRRSAWFIFLETISGLFAGVIAGLLAEDYISGLAYTSNGPAERLSGAGLIGVLTAMTVFGALTAVGFSLLRVQQAAFQSAGQSRPAL